MAFRDKLRIALSLGSGDETFSLPGGQVTKLFLRCEAHGTTGSVSFWAPLEDEQGPLFQALQKPGLLRVRLAVQSGFEQPGASTPQFTVAGLARSRSMRVTTYGSTGGAARAYRHHSIDFADVAQVLWRQHRPIELHTGARLGDLLAPFNGPELKLNLRWPPLDEERPLIFLGLGAQADGASFYDFVLWLLDSWGGYLLHDGARNEYTFAGEKPPAGKGVPVDGGEVERVEVELPKVIRYSARVLNVFAAAPTTTVLEQPQAAAGIRRDFLVRTPIAAEAELRATREKARLHVPGPRYLAVFKRFPSAQVQPGAVLRFGAGGPWGQAVTAAGHVRVFETAIEARALQDGPQAGEQDPDAGYEVTMSACLEPVAEMAARLPPYLRPRYPVRVEGKVHSPGGKPGDKTWFLVEDEQTSTLGYQVLVPLWNKTVKVPAAPHGFSADFYFPPYKDERVLLSLYFDRAGIDRYLDWGDGVRTPADSEGAQILLGKNKASQTALTHDYQDALPVWSMKRDSGPDHQLIKLSEGRAYFQAKEDPGAVPSIPTFDVTPKVELAKAELTEGAGGALGQATAAFQGALGSSKASIAAATAETRIALDAAEAALTAKAAEVRAGLAGALAGLEASTAAIGVAAADAKAALQSLV
jgi:hypothetical protein